MDGLMPVADARAEALGMDNVVGAASAFTPARAAHLRSLGLLGVPGGGGGSAEVANVGDYADFIANACGAAGSADALAVALAAVVAPVTGTSPAATTAHAAARAAGAAALEAARILIDALDSASIQWLVQQRDAMRAATMPVGGAQLGALAARAPAAAAQAAAERAAAAAAAAATAGVAPGGVTAPVSADAIAQQVAAMLRTQLGLPGGAASTTGAARAPVTPIPFALPPSGVASPPAAAPSTSAAAAPSPFPALDTFACEPVVDMASAIAAVEELGNGDAQRFCDLVLKEDGDAFNLGSALGLPIEEQLAAVEARLSSVQRRVWKQPSLVPARPAMWAAARQTLGGLLTSNRESQRDGGGGSSGGASLGATSNLADASGKPPGDAWCSPKSAGVSDRPNAVSAEVLDGAMGDANVRSDWMAAPCAELADECARLRTAFSQPFSAHAISNGMVFGTMAGKRGEGKLPIRFERARTAGRAAVVAELRDAVTPYRLDEVNDEVEACGDHASCCDFRLKELVRLCGGDEPGAACSAAGSAAAGRFGTLEGAGETAQALAVADIQRAAHRIHAIFDIVFVDVLGCRPWGVTTSLASSSPRLARLISSGSSRPSTASLARFACNPAATATPWERRRRIPPKRSRGLAQST
jgi:hypothetical protein